MTTQTLTAEQIAETLAEQIGETGSARLRGMDLMVRREENADERFLGAVADADEAQSVIDGFFKAQQAAPARPVCCHGCGDVVAAPIWRAGEPYCKGCDAAPAEVRS